jgi:hypothetical protein
MKVSRRALHARRPDTFVVAGANELYDSRQANCSCGWRGPGHRMIYESRVTDKTRDDYREHRLEASGLEE